MKTVIVTGAGSGIGEATARRFHADGWNVVLNGRTREKLEKVAGDLSADRTLIAQGDVASMADMEAMAAATVERFGGIDALVNNAGIAKMGSIEDLPREDWDALLAINVTGVRNCCVAAMVHLKASKGAIVNVASVSGLGGDWRMVGYNTAKGAVVNLTRAMALDLAGQGVNVNAVAPSLTRSDMSEGIMEGGDLLDAFRRRIPAGRPGEPEEVAAAIAFLAGPDAEFIHGVVLPVDGGLSASNGQPDLS